MAGTDKALIAHLLRRAGFGATYDEIERYAALGYENAVEALLRPEQIPDIDEDILERHYVDWKESRNIEGTLTETVYRFNARASVRPMQEKIALFWHCVFATGIAKVLHEKTLLNQIDMFRQYGLGSYRELLVQLSKDPAMIFWLDNNVNHKGAINENWGRELLELFSMGVGMDGQPNYSEEDVKEAARAFTGWTIDDENTTSTPFGKTPWRFQYRPDDHDDGEKTFLGRTGRFNGEDIIDIICEQPATARFVCRHFYNFFVADEPPVPSWQRTPPQDMATIKLLEQEYFRSHYDMRSILRVLFNSPAFKNARFAKVKSPAEVVVGTLHLVGDYKFPKPGIMDVAMECLYMGQHLLNPPTVEGWHTGAEWIDSGSLVERVNFVADQISDISKPGVRAMVERILAHGPKLSAEGLLDACLEQLGYLELKPVTRESLLAQIRKGGELGAANLEDRMDAEEVVLRTLKLIGATRECQFV